MRRLQDLISRTFASHVSGIERGTLLTLIFGAAALYVFAALADAVGDGGTRALDERVLLALRVAGNLSDPIGPKWF